MKTVFSKNVVSMDDVVKELNATLHTRFTTDDAHKWRLGKGSPAFVTAVKLYVSHKSYRIAASLGAMAAKLRLVGSGAL